MKKLIFFPLLFLFSSIFAQNNNDNDNLFIIIEDVPVYPGCKGDAEALKKCFSKSFQRFFAKKFDADLPNKLNLEPGEVRMYIFFRINENGLVDSIKVNAPHPELESSIISTVSQLPKMQPGKLKGEPVPVKYSIPFKIFIEETRAQRKARRKKEREARRNKN